MAMIQQNKQPEAFSTVTGRIGINGWFLQHPYTGIGQYTINLLKEFSRRCHEVPRERYDHIDECSFLVVVPNEACVERMKQEGITLPTEILAPLSWAPASIQKHWWEQVQLPRFFEKQALQGAGVKCVWHPYPCVTWWRRPTYTTIVTVHDTIPWTEKEYQRGPFSALAHVMSRAALRRADSIITVSETSAKHIVEVCVIPREKIHVIPNGVSDVFFKPADPGVLKKTLEMYGLEKNSYFLYVGGYDERKQVKKLLASYVLYAQMSDRRGEAALPLVLVGGKAHNDSLYVDFDTSDVLIDTPEAKNFLTPAKNCASVKVVRTGYIEEDVLAASYEASRGFLHFSRAEGFNIPLAQALAKHRPCGVSDIPIHREIAGEAAVFIDPEKAQAAQDLFRSFTTDINLLENLSRAAASWCSSHDLRWSTSAAEHLKIFEIYLKNL